MAFSYSEGEHGDHYCHGRGRVIVVRGWLQTDETGFITQDAFENTRKAIAKLMVDTGFKESSIEHQSVIIDGDTLIIMQDLKAKGKKKTMRQGLEDATIIISQFMQAATKQGYFDECDIEKLSEGIETADEEASR